MVLIELELGHSQRLLRRASSLAHGRACLPISPKTTRQLAISGTQRQSEVISSPARLAPHAAAPMREAIKRQSRGSQRHSPARLSPHAAAPASPAEPQLAVRWPRRWRRASRHPCRDGAPRRCLERRLDRQHPLGQLLAWRGLTRHAAAAYAAMPRARRAVGASGLPRPPSPRAARAAARSRSPDVAGNHMMREAIT
jgi:hypothetical protein